jgi:hypothetical protein
MVRRQTVLILVTAMLLIALARTPKRHGEPFVPFSYVSAIGVSPSGKLVALGTFDKQVIVWDLSQTSTIREGSRFTIGVVWMVIRSPKAFGDTRLVISSQLLGEAFSRIVSEEVVDPSWNMLIADLVLDEPGQYDIRVTTSRGDIVARSTVEVTPR